MTTRAFPGVAGFWPKPPPSIGPAAGAAVGGVVGKGVGRAAVVCARKTVMAISMATSARKREPRNGQVESLAGGRLA
jgi:hypothetical protein